MGFNGFLVGFNGGKTICGGKQLEHYIDMETYKASMKVQDMDSYRDANGELHRNALTHIPLQVEFETRQITSEEYASIIGAIPWSNRLERKFTLTAFIPEYNDYTSQSVYMPDPEVEIVRIDGDKLIYKPVKFKFVGY